MSKLGLFEKKGSGKAPEPTVAEAKSLRRQMAEQESGLRIVRHEAWAPVVGEVYEGPWWAVEWPQWTELRDLQSEDRYGAHVMPVERFERYDALRRLKAATIEAHPGLEPLFERLASPRYETEGEALCALERATYGFDLSGKLPEPEKKEEPAEEKADDAEALPAFRVTLTDGRADGRAAVSAEGKGIERALIGGDPFGSYASLGQALRGIMEATEGPDPESAEEKAERKSEYADALNGLKACLQTERKENPRGQASKRLSKAIEAMRELIDADGCGLNPKAGE